ncbi:uncharacterized protein BX663DRAFT_518355 [Cokeromyces recurvatus]|uniref:uncharacterized protein n=1 Tax=Cokeromyces recurvatus TaxID=90255 RepID=UPI002220571B|nr:uncharacterized protein BX663DRAFT_518355 [Cokeromyces recurvatus]KAI7900350.1 hypothetical protein BX663DRAFT_518355 [Cokeromyces recurvatus]
MTSDEHYICQRAANAIISEIGPFRVSTDALQTINQFLDEFIVLLLTCSLSLDLSQIKTAIFNLLPSTLGKNAIVEAELEVKSFTEIESIDYDLYERMRKLEGSQFPIEKAIPLLREKCFQYCTLADKEDQIHLQRRMKHNNDSVIVISPIVAIYVTTIIEHVAEYLLTAVAMTAEHEDTDYIRVKEVFLALIDDIQLGHVFQKMSLKDKMEKRAGVFQSYRSPYLSSISSRKSYTTTVDNETESFLNISFDDLDLDYLEDNSQTSTLSAKIPDITRPQSTMSHNTVNSRKSTYHLFKNNRNSLANSNASPRASVYDPDLPIMNFDDLIKSGETVKVSLTPNRLKSIETKDELVVPEPKWERRSISSQRLSEHIVSRPSSPLARHNTNSSHNVKSKQRASKTSSISSSIASISNITTTTTTTTASSLSNGSLDDYHQQLSIEVAKINIRNNETPTSPLSKKSFIVTDSNRFENPREAPKPPITPLTALSPKSKTMNTIIDTTPKSIYKPLPSSLSSPTTTDIKQSKALSKNSKSTNSLSLVEEPTSSNKKASTISIKSPKISPFKHSRTSSPELNVPQTSKSNNSTNTFNTNGMIIRRSSMSSKKSRESLRKSKEEEIKREPSNEPPLPSTTKIAKKHYNEEMIKTLTDEPQEYITELNTTCSITSINNAVKTDFNTSLFVRLNDHHLEDYNTDTIGINRVFNNIDSGNGLITQDKMNNSLSPERPSSIVAKRVSMLGNNRRQSLHESYATEKYNQDNLLHQRVSASIKQWDDKVEQRETTATPVPHRRSVLRQLQLREQEEQRTHGVLDKVLKFERRASSLDEFTRRERFMYLQQDPSVIEKKSSILTTGQKRLYVKPLVYRALGIDQTTQTDFPDDTIIDKDEEIHGKVEGDEEWFLQDWDDQEEVTIVEWLLGE